MILSRKKSLAAAVLASAVCALPATAQAQYHTADRVYENCKQADTENQILGGIIGAVAGGVVGSQVSGNGARTEGSAIGAALGAAAGAAIAGDSRNCKQEARAAGNSGVYYTSGSSYRSAPRYSDRTTYGPSREYGGRDYTSTHRNPGYSYSGHNRVENIKLRIDDLRAERDRLKQRQRYHYSPERARQIAAIGEDIRVLKKRKRNVKDRVKSRNDHYYYR